MSMRRLKDQVLVLQAIADVRSELLVAYAENSGHAQMYAILGRLLSLYATLNIDQIERHILESDSRDNHDEGENAA
jgi:hypothetical protein